MTCKDCKHYRYEVERGHLMWWCYNPKSDRYGDSPGWDDGCEEGEKEQVDE